MEKQSIVSRSIIKNLIRDAISGMDQSYAPYSYFKVGGFINEKEEYLYRMQCGECFFFYY